MERGNRAQALLRVGVLLSGLVFTALPVTMPRAEVVADPNAGAANRPTVQAAQNGVPLVQITAPSAAGVSRNQYQTFNVDPQGVVLNNSKTITQTQQAGWIEGNPNFAGSNAARVILNEVTSTNPSFLRGYTEVAGQRAEVVIANPNGITCNGCGFINASRGMLTTGSAVFDGSGNLSAFDVTGGNISIDGLGLNASNIDQVDLLARAVTVNAEVWTNYLNVITGANRVDYATLGTQTIAGTGGVPQFSLDVAALGGMYANRIRLVGTEAGVGVRNFGAIVSADSLTLNANGVLENRGLITAGGALSVSAEGLNNDGDAAVVASFGDMNLDVGGGALNNTAGATVYTAENLGIVAGSVLNRSSTIEAEGGLTLTANTIVNERTYYNLEAVTTSTETIDQRDGDGNGLVFTRTIVDQALSADSAPAARLIAGGEMTLNIGTSLLNDTSYIVAGGNLNLNGQRMLLDDVFSGTVGAANVINRGPTLERTTTDEGTRSWTERVQGDCRLWGPPRPPRGRRDCLLRYDDYDVIRSAPYFNTGTETLPTINLALLSSDRTLTGTAITLENFSVNPAVVGNTGQVPASDARTVPTATVVLPASGLYQLNTEPDHPYLYETDPRFADKKNFLSSDYMLSRLGLTPEETLKRLGDGFYEQKSVQDQIMQLTGRRFLGDYSGNEAQFQALMDAGLAVAEAFELRPGMTLSTEQVASLTHDIVWMEERMVRGQKVLAPVVYLSRTRDGDLDRFGPVIAGDKIDLKLAGDLKNAGTIAASSYSKIEAQNILNQGGSIQGGDYSHLVAANDIVNRSGTITAGDLTLEAGRDIVVETGSHEIRRESASATRSGAGSIVGFKGATPVASAGGTGGGLTTTFVERQASIEAEGSLTVKAGRDIGLTGANVSAGTDLTIDAGRDLTADAVRRSERVAVFYNGGRYERENTTHVTSTITAGQSADISAGRDIAFSAAQVDVGENLALTAGGDIRLTAVKDRELYEHLATRGDGYERIREDHETVRGTEIYAGGNITVTAQGTSGGEVDSVSRDQALAAARQDGRIRHTAIGFAPITDDTQTKNAEPAHATPAPAGSILLEGSIISSTAGSVTVKAGDITIASVSEHHESLQEQEQKKDKGYRKESSYSRDRVDQQFAIGSEISGESVVVEADHDLNIKGSAVVASDEVTLAAKGNIHIAAAEETLIEEHIREEKSSGFSRTKKGGTIGKNHAKSRENISATTAGASVVGSINGATRIESDQDVRVTGSDVIAGTTLDVTAQNIVVEEARERYERHFNSETKSTGWTTELSSGPQARENMPDGEKKQAKDAPPPDEKEAQEGEKYREARKNIAKGKINRENIKNYHNGQVNDFIDLSNNSGVENAQRGETGMGFRSAGQTLTEREEEHDIRHTARGSSLDAGGNVTLMAKGGQSSENSLVAQDGENTSSTLGTLTVQGSQVTSKAGDVTLAATGDVNVVAAWEEVRQSSRVSNKDQQSANTKLDVKTEDVREVTPSGSLLSGENIAVLSGKDIKIEGSAFAAGQDALLIAKGDIDIVSAEAQREHATSHSKSTTGLFKSSNFGVTLGKKSDKLENEGRSSAAYGSVVGTAEGSVDIEGRDILIKGSDVVGKDGITIVGEDVTIEAALEEDYRKQTSEKRQGGITLALTGALVSLVDQAIEAVKSSEQAEDERLQAVYTYRAGRLAYDAYGKFNEALNQGNGGNSSGNGGSGGGFDLSISIGASQSKNDVEQNALTARVATLTSQGDIDIRATGRKIDPAKQSPSPLMGEGGGEGELNTDAAREGGDLRVTGAAISGENVTLTANQDLILESATELSDLKSKNKASGGSIGISFGSSGFGITIGGFSAKGKGEGKGETHVESTIEAKDTLTLESGRDTTLEGAVAKAETIAAKVGRDLTLKSQQDIDDYHNRQSSTSAGITIGAGFSANFSSSKSKTDSEYTSVVEQTGIYAGKGGFDIEVGNHTDLTGAVISSEAEESKNRLSTKTLAYADIENEAKYKSKSAGITLSYSTSGSDGGKGMNGSEKAPVGNWSQQSNSGFGIAPSLSLPQKGEAKSLTRSAISPAQIIIRDEDAQKEKTGKSIEETLNALSRDPASAHQALAKIFDQKKVEETQELTRVFGEEAYTTAGDIGKYLTKDYEQAKAREKSANDYQALKEKEQQNTLTEKDRKLLTIYEQGGLTLQQADQIKQQAQADMARLQGQYDIWKDGGAGKILLHAIAGALQANLGGGSAGLGALAAGTAEKLNTYVADYLTEHNPNLSAAEKKSLQQLTSIIIGATAVKLAGGDSTAIQSGAITALQGESFNRQLHEKELDRIKRMKKGFAEQWGVSEEEAEARLTREALRHVDSDWAALFPEQDNAAWVALKSSGGNFDVMTRDEQGRIASLQEYSYFRARTKEEKDNHALFADTLVTNRDSYVGAVNAQSPALLQFRNDQYHGRATNFLLGIAGTALIGKAVQGAVALGRLTLAEAEALMTVGPGTYCATRGDLCAQVAETALQLATNTNAPSAVPNVGTVASKGARVVDNLIDELGAAKVPGKALVPYVEGGRGLTPVVPALMKRELDHATSSGVKIVANPEQTTTVLGNYGKDMDPIIQELSYPKTLDFDAKKGSFNVLNAPDSLYKDADQFWLEYNKPFLDKAIARGDDFVIATKPESSVLLNPQSADGLSGFGRELKYLESKGYIYDAKTNRMCYGGCR